MLYKWIEDINLGNLTEKDRYIAKRYIICRSAIKGFKKDLMLVDDNFELGSVYKGLIERALNQAYQELKEISKYPLRCSITDQPTVYQVAIGNRRGFIEINIVEIVEEVKKYFDSQN